MAKILVVDDDMDYLAATKAVLESKGHSVRTASSGQEGYAQAKADHPDLMLLDVMMTHDSEGFEIARKLKEDPATRGLKVIVVTGIRKAKDLTFGFEPDEDWLPVKAVLEKPVKADKLLKAVDSALKDG
jgi:CheY-like chemotaxis protein